MGKQVVVFIPCVKHFNKEHYVGIACFQFLSNLDMVFYATLVQPGATYGMTCFRKYGSQNGTIALKIYLKYRVEKVALFLTFSGNNFSFTSPMHCRLLTTS